VSRTVDRKSSLKTDPVSKKRLSDLEKRLLNDCGHLVVKAKYKSNLLKTRTDGTKVYMYEKVGKDYTIFADGNYVMRDITDVKQKWIMPDISAYTKPKRSDVHRSMEIDIMELIETVEKPTRRAIMKQFRLDKANKEEYSEIKNLSPALKRRIDTLIEGRFLEEEFIPKYKRKVLVKSKFKYV